ncbi:MAG: relaxase/mobilization nuclease domain-containing protein [Pseudomonadota bacterium]
MLMQDSQRGGAKNLALHLLSNENDHVEVFDLRGFVSQNLVGALNEIYAHSKGTRARKFIYAVSFNPPPSEQVSTEAFIDAIGRVENKMGLENQSRAIVFHEKFGRRHCHVVWSRVCTKEMKAIQLSHTKLKLKDITRELFIEHGWQLPEGYADASKRNPLNYTLAQWQQAKRVGKDPKAVKSAFVDAWAISDSGTAFSAALQERGYLLAKGDRRGFVAIDETGEPYSVAKWCGKKAKEVRAKLHDLDHLRSVGETRGLYASQMASHLKSLQMTRAAAIGGRVSKLERNRAGMIEQHRKQRTQFDTATETMRLAENKSRMMNLNTGRRGLFDRITGRRQEMMARLRFEEFELARQRQGQKDELILTQLQERQRLERRIHLLQNFEQQRGQALSSDIAQYLDIRQGVRDKFERESQKQHYSRDGPSLSM